MTDISPEPESPTSARRDVVVPDKAVLEGLEATWSQRWKDDETYKFDRTAAREDVYSIDTPPPTVSGMKHCSAVRVMMSSIALRPSLVAVMS